MLCTPPKWPDFWGKPKNVERPLFQGWRCSLDRRMGNMRDLRGYLVSYAYQYVTYFMSLDSYVIFANFLHYVFVFCYLSAAPKELFRKIMSKYWWHWWIWILLSHLHFFPIYGASQHKLDFSVSGCVICPQLKSRCYVLSKLIIILCDGTWGRFQIISYYSLVNNLGIILFYLLYLWKYAYTWKVRTPFACSNLICVACLYCLLNL